jgi:hypothetical protein
VELFWVGFLFGFDVCCFALSLLKKNLLFAGVESAVAVNQFPFNDGFFGVHDGLLANFLSLRVSCFCVF